MGNKRKPSKSSSSSSDEDVSKFADAVDPQFHKKLFIKEGENAKVQIESKPSLRRDKYTPSTDEVTGLNVTPEFKQFVATKLAEHIEKSFKTSKKKLSNASDVDGKEPDAKVSGVRLLSSSKVYLAQDEPKEKIIKQIKPDLLAHRKVKKKKKDLKTDEDEVSHSKKSKVSNKSSNSSSSSDDEDDAMLRESVVTPDWVMNKKGVYESCV